MSVEARLAEAASLLAKAEARPYADNGEHRNEG